MCTCPLGCSIVQYSTVPHDTIRYDTYLTVGVVAKGLVCLVKHHTRYLVSRAGMSAQIVLHHLRSEEEDSASRPQLLASGRNHVA